MLRLLPAVTSVAMVSVAAATAAPLPWTAAPMHVRRLVTIEGVVAEATCGGNRRCVLAFAPDDPAALRIVLMIPWVTDLPPDPAPLYRGKRVQVTGRVVRFQDHLEMAVTPAQIEVTGLTDTPPPAAPGRDTAPVAPAAEEPPPPRPAPAPGPPSAPAAAPVSAATVAPAAPPIDPVCTAWTGERATVSRDLRARIEALAACLAADRRGCAALGDALGPPLSRLQDLEARLGRRCP